MTATRTTNKPMTVEREKRGGSSAAVSRLMRENRRLRDWIRAEGIRTDTCTYHILGEICEGCRCERLTKDR